MHHRHVRRLLAPALAAACVLSASASTPIFWQVSTRAEFMKGEVENLAIDNDGRLSLGPASALVHDAASPFLWALVAAPDGSVYAGTGNDGKVFRVAPDGKASPLFDAPELEVHAVAPAKDGTLYAATSPDGRIYKVDGTGQATPFYDPEDKYIWSLAIGPDGYVYAATGERGTIYRIAPDGKGDVFYRTKATNVVSLAFDTAGNLLASTEAPGRVFRIDPKGKGFVLLDSPYREVRSLRLREDGSIYAAAVAGSEPAAAPAGEAAITPPQPARSAPVPTVTTEVTSITVIDVGAPETSKPARVTPRVAKGAVYRIGPDGVWDVIWESQEDTPYDVAFEDKNAVLIATGAKGKIYRVTGDPPQVSLVARAGGQQVTRFLQTARGETWYATSNPGKIFRFSSARAESGWFESEVRDATTVSSWGTISWRARVPEGARVELRTRSGNSATPDETWSPWSEAYAEPGGEQIRSPKARYLQWKATLAGKGESPVLTSVTTAYLQRNLRPRVTGITVYPPGIVFQKPFSTGETEIAGFEEGWPDTRPSPAALAAGTPTPSSSQGPALGRRTYQKGLQAFTWKAEDDNDDNLQYDVLYRRETDVAWKTVRRAITDQLFVWDTTSVPNGTYILRIVATDAPSNPPGAALAGEADSVSFDVDNTPPSIQVTGVRRQGDANVIAFEVRDDHAAVQRVDFSNDGTRWRPIYPVDGICDSHVERFELTVDGDPANVVIRAMDAMSNVSTARANGTPK
ncbi:MAG: SMP-30/gluconolactonase/LRE family protein [Acidobacteria bacterium]|nr:SMP-30/gluconolactonase/LRE family protein [Acidobacteriota bacterium]